MFEHNRNCFTSVETVRAVAYGPIKVFPAECKVPLQSSTIGEYTIPPPPVPPPPPALPRGADVKNEENEEDLSDIVLSTVAEELASMVACTGDQLEIIARNHNAGTDEEQMSYVSYSILVYFFFWNSGSHI